MTPRRAVRGMQLVIATVAATAAIAIAAVAAGPHVATAQTPPAPSATATPARPQPSDEQMLAVERQLLCPLCVNERLDVCTTAVCADMKEIIRERLAAGDHPDDIILFFENRYGPKVRARIPAQGFNLVLFGWVGGAIVLSGGAAAYALYAMRRDSRRRRAAPAAPRGAVDDAWVDRLVDEARADDNAEGSC